MCVCVCVCFGIVWLLVDGSKCGVSVQQLVCGVCVCVCVFVSALCAC